MVEGPQYQVGEVAINTGGTAVDPVLLQSAATYDALRSPEAIAATLARIAQTADSR